MKSTKSTFRALSLAAASAAALLSGASQAHAQQTDQTAREAAQVQFNIPAQSLASALMEFSRQARVTVVTPNELVRGRQSAGVVGEMSPDAALARLIAGSGLRVQRTSDGGLGLIAENDTSPTRLGAADAASSDDEAEEIVVVGTNIRGQAPVGANISVINREEIEEDPRGRIQDIMEALPQNFSGNASEDSALDSGAANLTRGFAVDLRGLGASSTLILVNGRRQAAGGLDGSFVDISSIAPSAVERIEILPDGASAIYGADAVGGVVNFVLRSDFDGAEINVQSATSDGAADEFRGSVVAGRTWSRGYILGGIDLLEREALSARDGALSSYNRDYTSLGGSDVRIPFANPATIFDSTFSPFAVPEGQDGTALTPGDLTAGQNYFDSVSGTDVLPEQRTQNAFFVVSQRITDAIETSLEGRLGHREMTLGFGGYPGFLVVPPSNAFYFDPFGDGGALFVAYDFGADFGPSVQTSETDTGTVTGALNIDLSSTWSLAVSANYASETNAWRWENIPNFARLDIALADSNPATAFNPFGDGSNTNPTTLAFIREVQTADSQFDVATLTAIASGDVFETGSGGAKAALGADYRDESVDGARASLAPSTGISTPNSSNVGSLERQVSAAFAELVVPFGGRNASGDPILQVSLAGRYESYSDFGDTFNPRLGISYQPVEALVFRATWGTSFRAPRFNEISVAANPPSSGVGVGVADPASPSGTSTVLFLAGNNPNLEEETAETWSAGFDFAPPSISALHFSATYWEIAYEGKIQAGGGSSPDTMLVFEDQWASLITRNPTGAQIDAVCSRADFAGVCPPSVAAILDLRLQNLGGIRTNGIDFDVGYQRDIAAGALSLGLSGTHIIEFERAVSASSPFVSIVDTVGNPPGWRVRAFTGLETARWDLLASLNYTNAYDDPATGRAVDSWTTVDLSAGYQFGEAGTQLRLGVINAFDEDPPFVDQSSGYDGANANQFGRSVRLQVVQKW